MARTGDRYSTLSIVLHWTIAAAVLGQILLINAHEAQDGPDPFVGWHKALGVTILVLTLVRVGWRLANPAPALPTRMPTWERFAAHANHLLFYAILIAIPLTGWLASSAGGREFTWFGLFDWPLLPVGGGREAARSFMDIHELAVKGLYVLLALHVLAALKHQFVDRDNVLRRMIPLIPRRS